MSWESINRHSGKPIPAFVSNNPQLKMMWDAGVKFPIPPQHQWEREPELKRKYGENYYNGNNYNNYNINNYNDGLFQQQERERERERQLALERERQLVVERERQLALERDRERERERERQLVVERERQIAVERERQVQIGRENAREEFYFMKRYNREQDQEEQCSLCLSDFQNNEIVIKTLCLHVLHKDCIDEWLQNYNKCPICQTPFGQR